MAGTDSTQGIVFRPSPAIILCEPQLGENIGTAARAIANFGLWDLRLVNPRDGWPSERAVAAASRADHVIERVRVFETTEAAIADLSLVFATTARRRDLQKPVLGPEEASRRMAAHIAQSKTGGAGLLFGRERWGLYNEEVALSDAIVTLPVEPAFASLNIAQAVLLMAYEWQKSGLASETDTAFSVPEGVPADKQILQGLFDHLEAALEARGYFRPPPKKPKMVDNLRAVLTRPGFTEPELRVLRGVVASLDYFSPKEPRGAGYPERKAKADREAGSGRAPADEENTDD
jgi:tRNA/rRNA methyltransferase